MSQKTKIGLFADNHEGGYEKCIARAMQDHSVDLIVGLGDIIDVDNGPGDMIRNLSPFCRTKIPTYVIPGNHESYHTWHEACKFLGLKYPNFHDATRNKIHAFNNLNMLFIPGTERCIEGEFRISNACKSGLHKNGMNHYVTNLKQLKKEILKHKLNLERTILFCHDPPEQTYKNGTDSLINIEDISTYHYSDLIKIKDDEKELYEQEILMGQGSTLVRHFAFSLNLQVILSGHIHRTSAITLDGIDILENQKSKSLLLNPGPANEGNYAIVHVESNGTIQLVNYLSDQST